MNLVFQKDFSDHMDREGEELKSICEDLGISFYPITIVPFEHTVVEENTIENLKGPTVIYGSNVTRDVVRDYGWSCGIFDITDSETNSYTFFGNDYINHDMLICRTDNYIESLKEYGLHDDIEYYFMKPNDAKYFPGTIVDKPMMPYVIKSQGGNFGTPDVYELCIAPIKFIEAEWRFFVVDKKIVTGSKYHGENLVLDVQAGYDTKAFEFAESMVEKCVPFDTFVIDIAKMRGGEYKVVELNCLNYSGFYAVDKKKLLIALKEMVDKRERISV